jgi:hypothetical protein
MVDRLADRRYGNGITFPITGHPLIVESRCILCNDVAEPESVDHIFPQCAYRMHPRVFAGIVHSPDNINIVPLCNSHHDDVDRNEMNKLSAFREHKLIGLIAYVADDYPRSPDYRIRSVQFDQWIKLFTRVKNQIWSLNGDSTPEYECAGNLVDYFLNKWARIHDFKIQP